MILSVSRRTDIPAFYMDWFMNRLKEGYVLVRNPMNHKQVSRIFLNTKDVECIVFWTKNPKELIRFNKALSAYPYYVQITLTSYQKDIETYVAPKKEILHSFVQLSKIIGAKKCIWRYDPIFISDKYKEQYHYTYFEKIAKQLFGYTNRCVISFVDNYAKINRSMKKIGMKTLSKADMKRIAKQLSEIARRYQIELESCSEIIELSEVHIKHGKCIDDRIISDILGIKAHIPKAIGQRKNCGCVKSIDIGMYNTCPHSCLYCYANTNKERVKSNYQHHDKRSALLFGSLNGNEKVTDKKIERYFDTVQLKL